jgi:MoaA/NifB/PqqE/SkfB family radical SAM enzyme
MHYNNIEIELTTACTLGCPGCPRNYQKHLKGQWNTGHMSLDSVKWIAKNTDFNQYLFVGCYGDPIYHPDIVQILDFYAWLGKRVSIETNASNTKKEIWDTINEELDLHTFTWTFSVDGLEDTNHIYRKRSNWSHIEYAMSKILSMPKERRPVTVWKWIEFPYNKHQTLEAKALAKSIGFDEFASVTSTRWRPYPKSTEDIEQYLFPKELELWKGKYV